MRKIFYFIMGLGILSFFSCTQNKQSALEKFVEDANNELPMYIDVNNELPMYINVHVTFDSIVLHEKEKNVIMYYSIGIDLDVLVESLKNYDTTAMKTMIITNFQNDSTMSPFLSMMDSANYSIGVEYRKRAGDVLKKFIITKEEYSKKIDPSQIENNRNTKMINEVNSLKSLCPVEFDEHTSLKDVSLDLDQKKLFYVYEVRNVTTADRNTIYLYENMNKNIKNVVDGPLELYKNANFTFIFHYVIDGDTMNFTCTPEDYN